MLLSFYTVWKVSFKHLISSVYSSGHGNRYGTAISNAGVYLYAVK